MCSKVPGARQPLVRTHPETGRKALFLGRRINAYVIGLPVEESEELLDVLWDHTSRRNSPGGRNGRSAISSGGTIAARCTAATRSTPRPAA